MRQVTFEITAERFKDKALVQRIKREARRYAGKNPGCNVVVKREITTVAANTHYKPYRRGRSKCCICWKPFYKHDKTSSPPYQCPTKSYWEVIWQFRNVSKQSLRWT